jgi:hypothetical protein
VHERAAEEGIAHYNAPLMLALALARGRLSRSEYEEYFDRLAEIGRYAESVLSFARAAAP